MLYSGTAAKRFELFFQFWAILAFVNTLCALAFWCAIAVSGSRAEDDWSTLIGSLFQGPRVLMFVLSSVLSLVPCGFLAMVAAIQPLSLFAPVAGAFAFYFAFCEFQLRSLEVMADSMSSAREDAPAIWSSEWWLLNADLVHTTKVIAVLGGLGVFISFVLLMKKSSSQKTMQPTPVSS